MQDFRFQPRLIPTLGMLCLMALFVYLGLWQAGKADRRSAELAQHHTRSGLGALQVDQKLVDPLALQDMPVTVRGQYEPEHQFFVDNRQENGKPGVHVVTPFKISGGETRILVNRGWVGWTQGRLVLPTVSTPAGEIEVSGRAAVPSTKKFFLMPEHAEADPRLWSRLDLERFTKEHRFPVQPVVVLQTSDTDVKDGLVRNWQPPQDRVAMHQSYSFQWFGMALALLIFYVIASVRKRTPA